MAIALQTTYYNTPIGTAEIIGDATGIQSVRVLEEVIATSKNTPDCLQECVQQLKEYFLGERTNFSVTLQPKGTEFQQKVWKQLQEIPFAKTTSYLEQSKKFGNVKAIRALASANGKNPIWILIPCHRVIGSDGSLTGYAGGIWRKKWLLAHENPVKQQTLF